MGWRVWYYDGTTRDSLETTVEGLPDYGLQIAVEYLENGYRNIFHGEFLYWDGAWHTALTEAEIPQGVKIFPGLQIPDPEFEWIQREAFASVIL